MNLSMAAVSSLLPIDVVFVFLCVAAERLEKKRLLLLHRGAANKRRPLNPAAPDADVPAAAPAAAAAAAAAEGILLPTRRAAAAVAAYIFGGKEYKKNYFRCTDALFCMHARSFSRCMQTAAAANGFLPGCS